MDTEYEIDLAIKRIELGDNVGIVLQEYASDVVENLGLPSVSQRSELLKFLKWFDNENDFKHYPNINEGIVEKYLKL